MNVGSSTSYRKAAGETTEWDDIQKKFGNGPPEPEKPEPVEEVEEDHSLEAQYAGASAAAMAEAIEDGGLAEDEEDELEAIRRRRIEQLKEKAKRNKFGHLMPLTRADYKDEVNEASKDAWVVLMLYNDAVPASRALEEVLQRLSVKHKATKFMKIKADQCIEGYPDRNVPTVLLYHKGENQRQIMGAGVYGGKRNGEGFTEDRVEWVLADEGAVETDLTEDPRPQRGEKGAGGSGSVYFTTESGIGFGGGAYDDREED